MYIISNYLSIIIVIGIIDNLAADYPTQFFLMQTMETIEVDDSEMH